MRNRKRFSKTLTLMETLEFDDVFVINLVHEREPQPHFSNQVPESERLVRLQQMIELQRRITLKKNKEQIGHKVEVYVEGYSKKVEKWFSEKLAILKLQFFRE